MASIHVGWLKGLINGAVEHIYAYAHAKTVMIGDPANNKTLADEIGTTTISSLGDGTLTGAISAVNTAVSNEATTRANAVSSEATARANADTAEATARANADTAIQNSLGDQVNYSLSGTTLTITVK